MSLIAAYPDKLFQNPNGWRVGAKVNSTVAIATPTANEVQVYNQDRADSKLAPAIAIAGTSLLTAQPTTSYTQAESYARPGLQYGVTFSDADQQMVNLGESQVLGFKKASVGCTLLLAVPVAEPLFCGCVWLSSTRTGVLNKQNA
jgi:hypothetical protein